jgi:hypothetical protein
MTITKTAQLLTLTVVAVSSIAVGAASRTAR